MIDKVHVYMCLHTASIKSTVGNKTRLFLSTFLISTSRLLILAKGFRNDHVAASSTALRSQCYWEEWNGWLRDRSVFVQNDTAQ